MVRVYCVFFVSILARNIYSPQLKLWYFLSCRCIGNVQFKDVVFGRDVLCDSHSAVVVHSLRRLRIYFILCDDLKQETMDK